MTNLWRGLTPSMTQRTNSQLMKISSITRDRRISIYWKALSISLMRLTIFSLLHIKSYSNGTLDWDILDLRIIFCMDI